ncbi:MAG TPA: EAL domain-containing protein [Pyrinomonadaceae bacterium]
MDKQKWEFPYKWTIIALGALVVLSCGWSLPAAQLDLRFLLLALFTIAGASRITVEIPRITEQISVSDTFIFLIMLLYGGESAVLLAAAEAFVSTLRFSRKPTTVLLNAATMACSTFFTASLLKLGFGTITGLSGQGYSVFTVAVCVMALAQYAVNTSIVAMGLAFRKNISFWQAWSTNYLWSSITYLMGAAVAGFIFMVGLSALILALPIIAIVYYTYDKYLSDIKTTSAQAEQAERERAEAEHARAEAERQRAEIEHERAVQAERHVGELNLHLAEQERISCALQESEEHFRHAAFHDALTGLPNRALLTEKLKAVIERATQHEDYQYALLFLDLDRFKNINDSLGHPIGDQMLIAMARRLEHLVREADTVARLGGDEFAILLDDISQFGDVLNLAERIQEKLTLPFNLSGHEVFSSASIGIAFSSTGYYHPESILRDADTAMYRAKAQGKACHEIFDKTMHARVVDRLKLEYDLRYAVEREEFLVYYQPIVSLDGGKLAGFEALVRWQHPERGLISPTDFVPVAEETGLIVPIGLWVLREACQQLARWQWQSAENRGLLLSVNLSGRQFAQPNLVGDIERILRETHLDPKSLKLEITESVVMENAETAISMLRQLKALGVRLSIDDFGTGYSSLSYLHRFPIDTLKIDRSFVSRMGENGENAEIVRTILTLAHNMGMEVIAEGIEKPEQFSQLKALQCKYGQGYLFSRPVNAEAMEALMASRQQWQPEVSTLTTDFGRPKRSNIQHLRSA